MELDLDKARAARAATGHVLTFGGVAFDLPPEMTVLAGELFADGDIRGGLTEMLNGQADKFFDLKPTINDLEALVNGVTLEDGERIPGLTDIYVPGTPVGESLASSSSSKKASTKPRQPSSATTAST